MSSALACSLKKLIALFALASAMLLLSVASLQAQTLTASPSSLSFGIPYGTSPAVSSAENVTVTIGGSGTVTFSSVSVSTGSPFAVTGNTCVGALTAQTTCTISVNLSTTSTTLVTDTLSISFTGGSTSSPLTVPLSGAYGAIKLFDETDITASSSSIPFSELYTIATKTLNLTCPASAPSAIIAGTPDGLGYVLVDNYITLSTPSGPVSDSESTPGFPPGNVCSGTGAVADSNGSDFFADCFTSNYQTYALGLTLPPPAGLDPDSFANPGNTVLTKERPNSNNAGGVPPISITSFVAATSTTYPEQTVFTLLSSGYDGVYDNSTLFLVTNCTAPGIVPGASVTLNAISTSNPASETQTAALDSSSGQNISFTASDAVAVQQGTVSFTNGVVPIVTDYPIPQQLFNQLVANTSAAPAVCFRMTGETDTFNQPMCKAFLFQCYDPSSGTTSGSNCTPYQSTARNVLFTAQFASPDGPIVPNVYNYLTTQPWAADTAYTSGQTVVDPFGNVQLATSSGTSGSSAPFSSDETVGTVTGDGSNGLSWTDEGPNACANVGSNVACAIGTGPALLMGSDNWLCPEGDSSCTPPLNVTTETSGTVYYQSNCVMEPPLSAANLCPFDVLTQFQGAADGQPGGATKPKSMFIPVANMPLPTASAGFGSTAQNGWINNLGTASASFSSSAATYPSSASSPGNPSGTTFSPAAPYTLTFGVSQAPTLPDTTYPVPGDQIIYNAYTNNSTDISPGGTPTTASTTAICSNNGTTPLAFAAQALYNSSTGTLTSPYSALATPSGYFNTLSLSEGDIYYLHYFTTDCAYTEGLVFSPTASQLSNGSANWASFPYLAFGVDAVAPTLGSCSAPSPTYNGNTGAWYNGNVTETCVVTDDASGIGPLTDGNAISAVDNTTSKPIAVTALPNTNNAVLQGSLNATLGWSTTCSSGSTCPSSAPAATIEPLVSDLAGNNTTVGPFSFNIDMQAPTVTGPTLTNNPGTYNGAPIGVSYSCTDTGSGVQSCTLNNTNTSPVYSTAPACQSPTAGGVVSCSATISASVLQSGTLSVTATDNVNNSYTSTAVAYSVGMASQTITFAALPNQVYGTKPFTISATASSGLAVSFTSTTTSVCTVSGSTVTLVTGGTCSISASQAGNSDYSAASSVTQSFTVTLESQTITFAALPNQVYGTAPFTISATASSGLAVSFTSTTTSICTVSGSTVTLVMGGACSISASQAGNSDYSAASSVTQSFTVTPATQTITFTTPPPSSEVNGGSFTVVATASSGLAVSFSASGACTITATGTNSATYKMNASTGSCSVIASQAGNSDYSSVTNSIGVNATAPAAWTITPSSYAFPTLSIGQKASETFVVTNPAGGATTSIAVCIPGSPNEGTQVSGEIDPDDYVITANGCTSALAGGSSCNVTVTWTPDSDDLPLYATGGSLAFLQVTNKSTRALLVQATMTGKAIDPTVTLTPESNTFTATSATTQLVATLSNPSGQLTPLILGNISINSGSKYFKLASGTNSCTASSTIVPGASACNVYVTFTPPSSGTATETGQVTIQSNAADGPLTVSLSGTR